MRTIPTPHETGNVKQISFAEALRKCVSTPARFYELTAIVAVCAALCGVGANKLSGLIYATDSSNTQLTAITLTGIAIGSIAGLLATCLKEMR